VHATCVATARQRFGSSDIRCPDGFGICTQSSR